MSAPPTAVTFVPFADASTLLAPPPGRRQALPGFDEDYVDFVDYIVRCTHRIWEQRRLELIRTHYTEDCVIHTLAGPQRGVEAVVAGTLATLQAFPDRTLYADHVIWSDDGPGGFYSSHRITSHMTQLGAGEFGAPSGRRATIRTIADCAVRANRIYEEWLVRDNWSLATQLGADPAAVARAQAGRDRGQPAVREYWARLREGTRACALPVAATPDAAAVDAQADPEAWARALFGAFAARALGRFGEFYSPVVEWHGPAGRRLFGRGAVQGWAGAWLAAVPDAVLAVEHVAAVPCLDLGHDVAVRWSLAGTHAGWGLHGAPTGAPVALLAVSHFRVLDGEIAEEWTVYDEIALLRQLCQEPA